jgi:hypothetical protein
MKKQRVGHHQPFASLATWFALPTAAFALLWTDESALLAERTLWLALDCAIAIALLALDWAEEMADFIAALAEEEAEAIAWVALILAAWAADDWDAAIEFAVLTAKAAELWIDDILERREAMVAFAVEETLARDMANTLDAEEAPAFDAEATNPLHSGRGGPCGWGNGDRGFKDGGGVIKLRRGWLGFPLSFSLRGRLARKSRCSNIRLFVLVTTFPMVSAGRRRAGPIEWTYGGDPSSLISGIDDILKLKFGYHCLVVSMSRIRTKFLPKLPGMNPK